MIKFFENNMKKARTSAKNFGDAAAGLAQIAQIASTSFGSGEAPSVVATGAGGVVQTVDPLEHQETEAKSAGNVFNLTVYGSIVDHDQFAREAFDAFERAANDGMGR